MSAGIRDRIKSFFPSTMQDGVSERLHYAVGLAADYAIEKMVQASHAHMPTKADASALPYIGQDRLIGQGLTETSANYALRLRGAFDDLPKYGSAWGVLKAVRGYLSALSPTVRTVSTRYLTNGTISWSNWDSFAAGASTAVPPTHLALAAGAQNWDWDGAMLANGISSVFWWRWWLILFAVAPNAWCAPAPFVFGTVGVTIGGRPDCSIGLNVPPDTISKIRAIAALWQGEHAPCNNIIISFDATLFDPAQASGPAFNPDGNFGTWAKVVANQFVPSRYANARYCTGA